MAIRRIAADKTIRLRVHRTFDPLLKSAADVRAAPAA
jgi:hypothetical protein